MATSITTGWDDSSLAACPKKSPYSYVEDESVLGSQTHEMSYVESGSAHEEYHLD
jgi:hypothetical protein